MTELEFNLTEHTHNHYAILSLYVFVCSLMDSNSIWLKGRSLSRPDLRDWEEDITPTKGDRNSLSSFLTSVLKNLCEIITGNHKLSHQNGYLKIILISTGEITFSYCQWSGFPAAARPVSVWSCLWPHNHIPRLILWTGLLFSIVCSNVSFSQPSYYITYLRRCCLDIWQPAWAQVQLCRRGWPCCIVVLSWGLF